MDKGIADQQTKEILLRGMTTEDVGIIAWIERAKSCPDFTVVEFFFFFFFLQALQSQKWACPGTFVSVRSTL